MATDFRSCQFGSGRDGLIQNGSRTILGNEEHVPKPTKLNMPLHSSISPVHTRAFGVTLLFDSSARAVTTVKYNSRHTRDMHWEYAYGPHLCRQHRRPQAPNTQLVTPACFTLTPKALTPALPKHYKYCTTLMTALGGRVQSGWGKKEGDETKP